MIGDSACAGHGGDGGFCHLLSPRDACTDLHHHHRPCKRARRWAPPCLDVPSQQQAKPSSGHHLSSSPSSPIDGLPDECLFEIFSRLTGSDERDSVACVSKRWLKVLSGVRSSTRMDCMHWVGEEAATAASTAGPLTRCLTGMEATDLRLAAVTARANALGGLRKLLIVGHTGDASAAWKLTDAGLTLVARGSPCLREVSISHAPLVTDISLSELSRCCPSLEKLELSRCPIITDKGLLEVAEKCPNLSSLTVEHCPRIGNRGLVAIGRCCPNLQSVSIVGCSGVGDQGIASLVCSASSSLTKMKLQNLNVSDVCLAVIGLYGKAIMDLTLAALRGVGERGFWIMGNARGLQRVENAVIDACPGATDLGIEALAKGCPAIRRLGLRRCSRLSDVGIRALAGNARVLEELRLEECDGISAAGLLGALCGFGAGFRALSLVKCAGINKDTPNTAAASSLRSLTVRDCPGFGDACLTNIRKMCRGLRSIELNGSGGGLPGVTNVGILSLVEDGHGACGLVKVDLSGCANVVDDGVVSAIAKAHGTTLKVLNLDGCQKVSDSSLLEIAGSCCVLKDLDVSGSSMITDLGVAALVSAGLQLRVLSLSGCRLVSDDSLEFVKDIGSLAGLNLLNCIGVGEPAVRMLQDQMDWCDIIF